MNIFLPVVIKELDIYDKNVAMTHAVLLVFLYLIDNILSKLVNGLVCIKCNNGWMSQLEGDCQDILLTLWVWMIFKWIYLSQRAYDTVAKWAFKNVILLNSATNYRQLVPNEHYVSLFW